MKSGAGPLFPPTVKKPTRRPKKKRRKATGEANSSKSWKENERPKVKCSKCKMFGHNTRTCKNEATIPKQRVNMGGRPPLPKR